MRRLAATAAAFFLLTAGTSANAEGVNNLLAGITGLLTFPADPPASCIAPPEAFEDMFGAPVTSHALGCVQGSFLMVYRAVMGALDIAFFPLWVFPTLSPESRYEIFPFYEIEYE
jgi:hypothetical protein